MAYTHLSFEPTYRTPSAMTGVDSTSAAVRYLCNKLPTPAAGPDITAPLVLYFQSRSPVEQAERDNNRLHNRNNTINLFRPLDSLFAVLEIKEVYPGTRRDDTCIAEISVIK